VPEEELDPDPLVQFAVWYAEAAAGGQPQPEAMALATTGPDGRPSVRMVLLRGHDARGFVFYTNRESRKAVELAASGWAAVAFHWQALHRQVRAEGRVEPVTQEESERYWATRPRPSRLAAWASPQSRPVRDRAELEALYAAAAERFGDGDVPLPAFWGGYRLVPDAVELWQGRENRFHDRVRYERTGAGWTRTRLAP
jgi:pyridoxamine 5'-phosphate oxidase